MRCSAIERARSAAASARGIPYSDGAVLDIMLPARHRSKRSNTRSRRHGGPRGRG